MHLVKCWHAGMWVQQRINMQYICEVENAVRLVSRVTKVRMRVSNSQCFFVIVHASTAYRHLFFFLQHLL